MLRLSIALPPKLVPITSLTISGSTPAFTAKTAASTDAAVWIATSNWLVNLMIAAGAGRSNQMDVLAHRLQDRQRAIKRRLVAANHDRQRSGRRAGGTATDRRVEKPRAGSGRLIGEASTEMGLTVE